MKKIKILTPILGLTAVAAPLLSATSCNNATQVGKLEWSGAKVKTVTHSDIELNKELTIVVVCEDNYILSGVEALKVGDTVLTLNSDFTVDLITGTIVIKADAMKNLNVNIRLSTEAEPVITADITSLYDEYLKTLEVYTAEKAAINYLFESALVSSLVGITVKIKNFKIDGATPSKEVPSSLLKNTLIHNQYLRLDFDIVKLFEYYEIEEDCVVTFDLQFQDEYTSLDKTITGYTLNITASEIPTPTEEYILSNQNDGISELSGSSFGCSWWGYNWWNLCASQILMTTPKLLEKLNCVGVEICDIGVYYGNDVLISFPQDETVDPVYDTGHQESIDMPSCVKTFTLKETTMSSSQSIYLNFAASTDTSQADFGFETINLNNNFTAETHPSSKTYFLGCIGGNTSFGSLYRNLNLKKIILTPYRPTEFTVYDQDGSEYGSEGCSPFKQCENLNCFDLTAFTAVADLDNITFTNGTNSGNTIFHRDSNYNTHAASGTIIVKQGATQELKNAISTKFANAGLTIDGTNWKIVEAE